jgi:peptidylprolyl isomerase
MRFTAALLSVSLILAGSARAEGTAPAESAAKLVRKAAAHAPAKPPAKPAAAADAGPARAADPAPVSAQPIPRPPVVAAGAVVGPLTVTAPAPLTDWRALDAENTLVIDTDRGRVIIELRPEFAPLAVAQVKRLARSRVYDGLLFHRVVDGFVAQTGDPNNVDGGKSLEPDLPAEFTFRLGAQTPRTIVARPQGETEGFIGAQPFVSVDEQRMALSPDHRVTAWGAYCPGVVGMGREADPDSANSEIFVMRATTRSLDARYSVVGRVIVGLETIRALPVGDPPGLPARMLRVQVLADMAPAERPDVYVLNTLSPQFWGHVSRVRDARGADFSICDVDAPVRVVALGGPAARPAATARRQRRRD